MLINTEVDSDDDASVCVHTAFSGLNGTDMCNVGMLLPLQPTDMCMVLPPIKPL